MIPVNYKKALPLVLSLALLVFSCQKETNGPVEPAATSEVEFNFQNVVSGNPLALGDTYNNMFLESYQVSEFKYYISNIELRDELTGETTAIKNTFFLVDEKKPASKKVQFKVPPGNYFEISFLIGVDSIRNMSGAQSGALDPALGMFWTWNSGYIMAKLEGTSPSSSEAGNAFEYHIGGFKAPNNVLRRVKFTLPASAYVFNDNTHTILNFNADVNDWFRMPHDLSIGANSVCATPGDLAMKYADNYAKMFSLIEVLKQ